MRKASYVIIPIGLAGIPVGLYEALTGLFWLGLVVITLGIIAAALAAYRLWNTPPSNRNVTR
jgi:hypothetical protein